MQQHITQWLGFFQVLLLTKFRQNRKEAIETLIWLIVGHLFGLYNPNQLAEAIGIAKANLYRHLSHWSVFQWRRLLLEVGCHQALKLIFQSESMSASTQSRRRITLSVDDTVMKRFGQFLSYCYHWWSTRFNSSIKGQNILAITIKIGEVVIPLSVRLVGKQGRANTNKPDIFKVMMTEVKVFFEQHGVDITHYPITFDSWYGSQPLREVLEQLGFKVILVHGKSNYVFIIEGFKAKLSKHKRRIVLHGQLQEGQWGCPKPVARIKAHSPTFGDLVLLFFEDQAKCCCMMVFGRPLRAAEILSIWRQHHGIEQFWRSLKSIIHLSAMSLQQPTGAYATLGVKVSAYLLLLAVSMATGQTLHQIQLRLSGQIHLLVELMEHFQTGDAKESYP